MLGHEELEYKNNYFKMWLVMVVGLIIGLILSPLVVTLASLSGHSFYKRDGLDQKLLEYIGDNTFDDIAIDDLVIASYDYNSRSPRFFSKYMAHKYPTIYSVKLREAVGGSAAAPTYFDPEKLINKLGYEEQLVDGGIICNNPVMYAYQLAKFLKKKSGSNFNIISLGTGETPIEKE